MSKHAVIIFSAMVGLVGWQSGNATVRYVNVNSANPTRPYVNWATAATVMQDAENAALPGDEILVTHSVGAGPFFYRIGLTE